MNRFRLRAVRAFAALACGVVMAGACGAADGSGVLPDFEREHGITSWPRLGGCGYDRAWTGVVGTVLHVRAAADATGRRLDSAQTALRTERPCKGAIWHSLENWPTDLPSGTYVVAASAIGPGKSPTLPVRLKVIAVARGLTPQQAEAVARQVDEGR